MKQRLLIGAFMLALPVLVLTVFTQKLAYTSSSEGPSSAPNEKSQRQRLSLDPNSQIDGERTNSRLGSVSNESERRASRERAIAAQEKIVQEKRSALSRYILANADAYREYMSADRVVAEKELKFGDEVGGYVDLKKEFEVELNNLMRMKNKPKW